MYPLVNVYITMENHHVLLENSRFPWPNSIVNCSSLPKGISGFLPGDVPEDFTGFTGICRSSLDSGFHRDAMGLNSDLMVFYSDLMGFYSVLMRFNGIQ